LLTGENFGTLALRSIAPALLKLSSHDIESAPTNIACTGLSRAALSHPTFAREV
jgi:hypothetical protein